MELITVPPPHPPARAGHSCVAIDDKIYVYGGADRSQYMDDIFIFDIVSSRWSALRTKGRLPARANHLAVLAPPSRRTRKGMLIFAGADAEAVYADFHLVDIESATCISVRPAGHALQARSACCGAIMDDELYIFGGFDGSSTYFGDLCICNLTTYTWRLAAHVSGTAPSARAFASASAARSSIYFFGGVYSKTLLNDLFVLHTDTMVWETVAPSGPLHTLPTARMKHTITYDGMDNLVLLFGTSQTTKLNEISVYNIPENSWKVLNMSAAQLPSPRTMHDAVCVRGQLYIFGGYLGSAHWVNDFYRLPLTFTRNGSVETVKPAAVSTSATVSSSSSSSKRKAMDHDIVILEKEDVIKSKSSRTTSVTVNDDNETVRTEFRRKNHKNESSSVLVKRPGTGRPVTPPSVHSTVSKRLKIDSKADAGGGLTFDTSILEKKIESVLERLDSDIRESIQDVGVKVVSVSDYLTKEIKTIALQSADLSAYLLTNRHENQEKIVHLEQQLHDEEIQRNRLEAENKLYQETVEDLKRQLTASQAAFADLTKSVNTDQQRLDSSILESLVGHINRLQTDMEQNASTVSTKFDELIQKSIQEGSGIENLTTQLSNRDETIVKQRIEINEWKEKSDKLESELQTAVSERSAAVEKYEILQNLVSHLNSQIKKKDEDRDRLEQRIRDVLM